MRANISNRDVALFLAIFGFTMFVQTFHMVEHVAQMMQRFMLDIKPAHGLIGRLDLESVHLAFNTLYLILITYLFFGWRQVGHRFSENPGYFTVILLCGVAMQSYHEVEHVFKYIQFLDTGVQGTPGILGNQVNGVLLHFIYNLFVFSPVAIVFIGANIHRHIWNLLPKAGTVSADR